MGNKLGIHNKIEELLKESDPSDDSVEYTFAASPDQTDDEVKICTEDKLSLKKLGSDGDKIKSAPNLQNLLTSPIGSSDYKKRSEAMKTDSPKQEPDTTYQDQRSQSGRTSIGKETCEKAKKEPYDKISLTSHMHNIIDEHMVANDLTIHDSAPSIILPSNEYFPRLNCEAQSLQRTTKSSIMLCSTTREDTIQRLISYVHQKSKASASTVNSYSKASVTLCNPLPVVASSPKSSCTVTSALCSKSISTSEPISQTTIASVSAFPSKPNKASLETVTMSADTTHSDDQHQENDFPKGSDINLIRHLIAEEIAKDGATLKSMHHEKIEEVVQKIAVKLATHDVHGQGGFHTDRKRTVYQRGKAVRSSPGSSSRLRTFLEAEDACEAIGPKVRRIDDTSANRTPFSSSRLPQECSVGKTNDNALPQIASVYSTRALDLSCRQKHAPGSETTETPPTKVITEAAEEEGQHQEEVEKPLDLSVSKGTVEPKVETESPPGPQTTLHYPPQQTQSSRISYPPFVHPTGHSVRAPEKLCASPRSNRFSSVNPHPRTYHPYPRYCTHQDPPHQRFPHSFPRESSSAFAGPSQNPYPPAFFPPPLRPAGPPSPYVTIPRNNNAPAWFPYTRFPVAYSNSIDPRYQN